MKTLTKESRKLMIEFLYDCHQKLWGELIKDYKKRGLMPAFWCFVSKKKSIFCNLFPTISSFVSCFGCIVKGGGELRGGPYSCNACFLPLNCEEHGSLYSMVALYISSDKKECLKNMVKIKNCGYKIITTHDDMLIELFNKMR